MAKVGTGSSITFATGFFAELTNVEWDGIARAALQTSHMGTTSFHTKTPASLVDPGVVRATMWWAPETTPPWGSSPETLTLTVPSAGAGGTTTWAASGFLTQMSASVPMEDLQSCEVEITLSGTITVTA